MNKGNKNEEQKYIKWEKLCNFAPIFEQHKV